MKPLVSMRGALSDDELLGKALKGDSWASWRVLLIACMGEALTDDERKVFTELTGGREREPGVMAEEVHAVCGRRSGKTKAVSAAAVYFAALCDYSDKLAAGERAVLPILSASVWQSQRAFNFVRGIFAEAPALKALVQSETADTIRLVNVDIECRPASYRTIRGASCIAVIADETAFWWTAETARNPDTEIFNAARPALATTGGPLLCVTSPYGKRGEAWATFRRDYGPDGDPKIVVINAPSRRMNPLLSATVVQRAYERDPQAAASEFGGQFRNDISGFLDFAVIDGAVDRGVAARPRREGVVYRSACDMSGGAHDSAALCIAHDEDETAMLDCCLEIRAPFNPTSAVEQIAATLREYGLSSTVGDKYASGWVVPDAFARVDVTYTHSEVDRSEAYLNVLPKFMAGKVRLLDNARLISQFASLERRSTPVGRDRVDHGVGGKDDCSNAAALVLSARSNFYDDLAWVGTIPEGWSDLPYFSRLGGL